MTEDNKRWSVVITTPENCEIRFHIDQELTEHLEDLHGLTITDQLVEMIRMIMPEAEKERQILLEKEGNNESD